MKRIDLVGTCGNGLSLGFMRGAAGRLALCVMALVACAATPAPAQITRLMSVATGGAHANESSYRPSISADGRYVAFDSGASNLVMGDTNTAPDIFVRDRATGTTTRVNVGTGGAQANAVSYTASISADGRYVAFESFADNLVMGDTNLTWDIFVHDRTTGATTKVSVATGGAQANNVSYSPSISADGRYVAFESRASNLVMGDTNFTWDVFVHDRTTGATTRVSVSSGGAQASDSSFDPSISADGRYVAFWSNATVLVPGDGNSDSDVFVHDRTTGQTTSMSRAFGGPVGAQGNGPSEEPSISADGRYVAFFSLASDLVISDSNMEWDVFVHDRTTVTTTRVSVATGGAQANFGSFFPSISADGRYVAFHSGADNLVMGDTNAVHDAFVHDRTTGTTTRVSVATGGTQADDHSQRSSISADGRSVAFNSYASNLVSSTTTSGEDIFLRTIGPDGTSDFESVPVAVQDTQTSLSDSTFGDLTVSFGSELDGAWVVKDGPMLVLTFAGNVDFLQRHLEVFIDSIPGGQNRLLSNNAAVGTNPLGRMGDNGSGNGLRFDAGFEADYFIEMGDQISTPSVYYATLPTAGGGIGRNLGSTNATGIGVLSGDNPDGIMCTFNNSNIVGVTAGTAASSGLGVRTGVELAIPLSAIGNSECNIRVCAFLTSSSHSVVSNQVLDALGGGAALGDPRNVNFAARSGEQNFQADAAYNGYLEYRLDPAQDGANLGRNVSLDEGEVLVGARRFDRPGANDAGALFASTDQGFGWSPMAQVALSTLPASGDRLGNAVAHDAEWAFVGAPNRNGAAGADIGVVWVLERTAPGVWTQRAILTAPDSQAGANFGFSVDVRDGRAIVGAPNHDAAGVDSGKVYLYEFTGTWNFVTSRAPSDGAAGDHFGLDVAITDFGALIGAPGDDRPGLTDAGAAYLYLRTGAGWPATFDRRWEASDAGNSHAFGSAVELESAFAAVGATGATTGAVYPYFSTGSTWPSAHGAAFFPLDGAAGDTFGFSIASAVGQIAVGAPNHGTPFFDSGAVYTYALGDGAFTLSGKFSAPDSAAGDALGGDVAIDGVTLLAGAGSVDGGGTAYLFQTTAGAPAVISIPPSTSYPINSMQTLEWTYYSPTESDWTIRRGGGVAASGTAAAGLSTIPLAVTMGPATIGTYRLEVTNACAEARSPLTTIVLAVVPGDADGNGVVNFSDVTNILANFGTNYGSGNTGPGDADGNGVVNFADITAVLANFPMPVSNDTCDFATLLTVPAFTTGSTTSATADPGATTCGAGIQAPGVWYAVIGDGTTLTASTCSPSTTYDTILNIYRGTCGSLVCVNGNDDATCAGNALTSRVTWCAEQDVAYFILVQGFNHHTGPFGLSVISDGVPCGVGP